MQAVAKQRFSIKDKGYRGEPYIIDPNIMGMARVDSTLFIVHKGGYRNDTIIYMHDRNRGIEKAAALKCEINDGDTVYDVLFKLAPRKATELVLMGGTIEMDVDGECFVVNGKPIPWRVKRIYQRDELHNIKRQTKDK